MSVRERSRGRADGGSREGEIKIDDRVIDPAQIMIGFIKHKKRHFSPGLL